ncbi:CHAT domain-containing protein [Ancylothrix sp. C2]|uniref:CHAT domain-containing protein n=1 Tax=Ancylothrix sp. D3o TaxID=2953691 RepID=UPI0021BA5581|nr:CHAT domain-containing protein [Ancylothrix sp. D3o]MCT7950091.1 CHAT domain-containing protein [Ancylothrix sp. D3o]
MNLYGQDQPPDIYRGFQKVLIAQNRIQNALEVAEQGRYRALKNLFITRLGIEPKFPHSNTPPDLARIQKVAKTFNATLVEYSIIYNDNQISQLSGYRLPFDDHFAYAEALFIWLVKPSGDITFRKVNLKAETNKILLSTLVRSLRESINAKSPIIPDIFCHPPLHYLYQFLIQPIADLLPSNPESRVIFIPQDFLFLVPFCALQDSDGSYLIEKHTISMAPSIFYLELTLENQRINPAKFPDPSDCLIVGNPIMPSIYRPIDELDASLSALPNAEIEALQVAELLETEALIGLDATKTTVLTKITTSQIIHFATHILGEDKGGLAGAIALTPSPNDGFLRLFEILQQKINAELVVLSGYDTTHGKLWGDGVVMITSGFLGSGALSLILSLWQNNFDKPPSLIKDFYHNWLQTGDKALSLRNAMLATMKEYPQPQNWAWLVLIGHP